MAARQVPVSAPFDLAGTFGAMTTKVVGRVPRDRHVVWWVTNTAAGPATLRLQQRPGRVDAEGWGPGADLVLDSVPRLIGRNDDPSAFAPAPGLVADLHRRRLGLRLGRTDRVFQTLLPVMLGQRVTTVEAGRSYRSLVRRYGVPAPGPLDAWVSPPAKVIARLSYADFHPHGVERSRAGKIIEAARRATRLEAIVDMSRDDAYARLTAVRGIGPWTAAQVLGSAVGDPDAIPVGDYHIPNLVTWALAGEPRGDDARMLELLEPYAGHRRRVLLLLKGAGISAPKYGPKTAPRDIRSQ